MAEYEVKAQAEGGWIGCKSTREPRNPGVFVPVPAEAGKGRMRMSGTVQTCHDCGRLIPPTWFLCERCLAARKQAKK